MGRPRNSANVQEVRHVCLHVGLGQFWPQEAQAGLAMSAVRSKYNVDLSRAGKERRTMDNITFDSMHEMEVYANYIRSNVNAGIFRNLRIQHPMPLFAFHPVRQEPVLVCYYVPDFVFEDTDGKTHVVDAKGRATALYRLKKRWFSVCYPDLRIEEL